MTNGEYRKHTIDDALLKAILDGVGDGDKAKELTAAVMQELDRHRLLYYSSPNEISLLSAAGRVLVALAETPDSTQRSLAVFLGVSEGAIRKSVDQLVAAGVVAKTKVKGRNMLVIVPEKLAELSDIKRFSALMGLIGRENDHELF